ncbi:MAG: hypothetical protein J5833_07195 [Victivallales bacterium]|nr:hypothetical protein [Victivallales bacterium]
MTPEQQLVQQIQQVLGAANIEKNAALEDLAIQFSELCDAANARLARCVDYINKGMRSEAVNEIHNLPDLFVLADLLSFEGARKWRNLCADLEMPIFQPLDAELLDKLKKAAATESDMEPLLREYRRFVYEGDHRNCILMLRKIREADPDNPSWAANLKPLEEEELPTLVRNAEEALMDDDHVRLKALYDEFTVPQRVVEPPPELMERMRRELLSERAADLKLDGMALLKKLRSAVDAADGALVEAQLSKMEALAADDAFIIRPDGWDSAVSDAKEMLALQARRRERNADFMKAADALQEMLARGGYTELELRHEWERLLAWEMPVSDMLRRQVEETLGEIKAARRRRVRIVTGVAVLVILAVLSGIGIFGYLHARKEKEQAAIVHMEELLEAGNYGELELYIEDLRRKDPRFANTAAVADKARKVQDYLKNSREAREAFEASMQRLGTIRSREYADATPERIEQLLKDAELEAKRLDNKMAVGKVVAWRKGWEDWRERRLAESNDVLKSTIASINSALLERRSKPFTDFEKEDSKIKELKQMVENARSYANNASESEREKFADAQERLAGWDREFADKRQKDTELKKEIDELKASIPAAIMQFGKYKPLLERYVELAQENDSVRQEYKNVLANFGLYEGAVLRATLPSISVPPSDSLAKSLEEQLADDAEFKGTVWEGDMRTALAFHRIDKGLKAKLNNLLNESPELLLLYYIEYRRVGEERWKRLYSPKPLVSGPHPDDNTVKIYWGNVYFTKEEDGVPTLMHTKNAFPSYLSTREFEIRMEDKGEDNRCEYAKFLFRLLAESANAKNMTVYILNGMQQLYKESKMEPVMRALLIKRLIGILADEFSGAQNGSLGEIVPEFAAIRSIFARVSTDVPWMNPANQEVIESEATLQKAISEVPDTKQIVNRLKNYGIVLESILNSGVRCVGSCVQGADGAMALDLRGQSISEIWGCFSQTVGAQPYFAVISDDGKTLNKFASSCHVGMPVFAPAAGCEPNAALKRGGLTEEDMKALKRPMAWPINTWK